jgi:Skp family chaperone for outer membrane proteins
MNRRALFPIIILCWPLLFAVWNAHGQEPAPVAAVEEAEIDDGRAPVRRQLQDIQTTLQAKRSELSQARRQLRNTTDELERKEWETGIAQLEEDIKNLRRSFEDIALGGLDLSVFDPQAQIEEFNWEQELKIILKPLFQALKQITEKPRQIERLNSQIATLDAQIRTAQRALENVDALIDDSLDKPARDRLENVRKDWARRADDLQRDREINLLQLKVLKDSDETILQRIQHSLSDFLTGRGLNLVLAIGSFFLVYFFMKSLYALYLWVGGSRIFARTITSTTNRRIIKYVYQAVTITLSIAAVLIALYMLGDILLLLLAVIVLLIVGLGMRTYLPRYIQETKLLLNIGAVRERERVIYKDLPWLVRSLGMYSKLYNPALDGLLRLPLSEMLHLVSRPFRDDEPWFPTAVGDWVMMADGTIGQVMRQTPEIVQIRTKGTVQTQATTSFIANQPRNLSEGYGVAITFGLDYQHQDISTTQVEKVLKQAIEKGLRQSDAGPHVENILVEFKDAGASSLNYLIYVTMKGSGAEHYFVLNRLVQRICVDTCNEHGWVIPFNQLTVHTATNLPGISK